MTTNIPQGTLLDVLKKKMRQTKEEMEKYKDECEEYHKRLQLEVVRREEVSPMYGCSPSCYFRNYMKKLQEIKRKCADLFFFWLAKNFLNFLPKKLKLQIWE